MSRVTLAARRIARAHNRHTPRDAGATLAFDEDGAGGHLLDDASVEQTAADSAALLVTVRIEPITERFAQDIYDILMGR